MPTTGFWRYQKKTRVKRVHRKYTALLSVWSKPVSNLPVRLLNIRKIIDELWEQIQKIFKAATRVDPQLFASGYDGHVRGFSGVVPMSVRILKKG